MNVSKISDNSFKLQLHNVSVLLENTHKAEDESDIYISNLVANKKSNDRVLIDSPGEYEIKNVFIRGVGEDNVTSYKLIDEDINIMYVKPTSQKTPKEFDALINDIDILILRMDSDSSLSEKDFHNITTSIAPKLVIPIGDDEKKQKVLIKEAGEIIEAKKSKSIRKKDFPSEGMNIMKFI